MSLQMRRILCAALLAVLWAAAPNPADAAPGRVFRYRNPDPTAGVGYFERVSGANWMEIDGWGTVYRFNQTRDFGSAVEMYDSSRAVGIRITERSVFIRFPGSDGWQFRYSGRWID